MSTTTKNSNLRKMVFAAACLALAIVLPSFLGGVQVLGQAISPMHIPAFLCGFLCGWPWAIFVGFIAPILRGLLFGMPPLWPVGVRMAFELAAYGFCCAIFFKLFKHWNIWARTFASLIIAMILGRIFAGIVTALILGFGGNGYTISAFIASYVTGTAVGMVIHLIVVPVIVVALYKAGLIPDESPAQQA